LSSGLLNFFIPEKKNDKRVGYTTPDNENRRKKMPQMSAAFFIEGIIVW